MKEKNTLPQRVNQRGESLGALGVLRTTRGLRVYAANLLVLLVWYSRGALRSAPSAARSPHAQVYAPPPSPLQCSPDTLSTIRQQLPGGDCQAHHRAPWTQQCSHTYATRCPDALWFEEHYRAQLGLGLGSGSASMAATSLHGHTQAHNPPFVGIFVGCNKGMDAVNTLRMGSGDASFDIKVWKNAMTQGGTIHLHHAVCAADKVSTQFEIPAGNVRAATSSASSSSRVFCIEPMPATAQALTRSASTLGWDAKGFVVVQAAIAKVDGAAVPFPVSADIGVENQGMGNCREAGATCQNVSMYSLDTFVDTFMDNGSGTSAVATQASTWNPPEKAIIDYLSVDVEGYDFDVLLGAQKNTLPRVRYLEFEYNWMGSWGKQTLFEAIQMLDTLGFTCYWPGFDGHIWRITKCWLEQYKYRFWSNVACVNRNLTRVVRNNGGGGGTRHSYEDEWQVATRMEDMFNNTVAKGGDVVMNNESIPRVLRKRHGGHT